MNAELAAYLPGATVSDERTRLSVAMRWLLLGCGPVNLTGAVVFAPPFPDARRAMGLVEPHPVYLWLLSAWILAFGVALFFQGLTRRGNRAVLLLSAWGKGTFAALLLGLVATGELLPFAVSAAVPDLILAVVFFVWVWRSLCRPA